MEDNLLRNAAIRVLKRNKIDFFDKDTTEELLDKLANSEEANKYNSNWYIASVLGCMVEEYLEEKQNEKLWKHWKSWF